VLDVAVARKYARALFSAALAAGNAERVHHDLDAILALRNEDPKFLSFLVSPQVDTEQKRAFIQAVFDSRVDPLVGGFLRLLVDKGRIVNLPRICTEYGFLSEEHRGIIRIGVISAGPMEAEQEKQLSEELARRSGRKVILEKKIDPGIIGGIILHYQDKIIDRSIRRGLKTMSDALLASRSV